ncbi:MULTISPECIES: UDP-N-acetylmuramate--L-alanine ligase [Clostridium]|uniref:UDP-N-acetylmuramate--L-alanine ligase n=1 Tax=Clostridium faecium TaxID=2762223 RepID=A0ABR8YQB3_9CLOT|nr:MULTISPECIES: UDP-N-acetylmuramate--L-alanine ligase [Clostridium]MBD8046196.1 UDP-N-acetylmuramate--L-alanine ligase [Clostridium faecium]MDU1350614.1 UDP-N-acetylmuramate--L-alanine ligase [Clostridium argentinense]
MSFDFLKDKNKKIHFIGIGGISMSGLAEILIKNGYKVSGSDMKSSPITEKLKKHGAEIYIGHNENNIKDVDLVVFTAAISPENPELIKAKEDKIQIMYRAEFLGYLMKGHKYGIAISGTHGKTTTTSMVSHIILEENLDPTILVGGELDIIGGNVLAGCSDYFITEACEYKSSFLNFFPYIGVILNVDEDHLDYYKDLNHIKDTFKKFVDIIPNDGYAIVNADDHNCMDVALNAKCNLITFGIDNGQYRAKNINYDDLGCGSFDLYKDDEMLFKISLNVPGKHNILNSLSAICTGLVLNVSKKSIIEGLFNFKGTHRRFELKGKKNNITVIDDYAHHPTEIKATLEASKNYPHNKLFAIFQPHTYTRTISLFNDFVESFDNVDELLLADIYAAREKDTGVVSSLKLGDAIRDKGINAKNFHSFEEIVQYLKDNAKDGDLILTIGAGDVYKIGEMFLK